RSSTRSIRPKILYRLARGYGPPRGSHPRRRPTLSPRRKERDLSTYGDGDPVDVEEGCKVVALPVRHVDHYRGRRRRIDNPVRYVEVRRLSRGIHDHLARGDVGREVPSE